MRIFDLSLVFPPQSSLESFKEYLLLSHLLCGDDDGAPLHLDVKLLRAVLLAVKGDLSGKRAES